MTPNKPLGLVTIGAALVDVLAHKDHVFLDQHGLKHGAMVLQSEAESATLLGALPKDTQLVSGGSAANTGVVFAMLGGKSAFTGRVKDDALGKEFKASIESTGAKFVGRMSTSPTPTGRCIVVVSEHGGVVERTMATFLGASTELTPEDISDQAVRQAQFLFIEGYTWDSPSARAAVKHAIYLAKQAGTKVAFTLSDPFCVERHREDFLKLVEEDVDVLFANEHEIEAMYGEKDMKKLLLKIHKVCDCVAVTFSEKGSFILTQNNIHRIAPVTTQVVDVTGAGDAYAAGVLYGFSQGWDAGRSGALGSACASHVISHMGGRPKASLKGLVESA